MRIFLHILLLTPFLYSLAELFILKSVNDPIKYIYTMTGYSSMIILLLCTFLPLIKNHLKWMKYRKMIGLYGFFYALLHFINFIILDAQLDISFVFNELFKKPFIYLGFIAFIGLLFMAITSTKRLFRKYSKYHKIFYITFFLIVIHFIMAQKSLNIEQYLFLLLIISIFIMKLIYKNNTNFIVRK